MARQDIFFDDQDRDVFLQLLAQAHHRWGIIIHAYCLMTNHYHLDLQTPEGHLSRSLQWLNQNYASHVNRRYQRSGHLFQGRFKNVLRRLAPSVFLLARGTRLAADITGCPVLARGLKSAFEKPILSIPMRWF